MLSFQSFVRLGWAFARVVVGKLNPPRDQLARFVDHYERDGIILFAPGEADVLRGASRCIACGLCDVEALTRGAFDALSPHGPMAFVLGVSRHSAEHDAAELRATATPALLDAMTAVCPVDVPFVALASLVRRRSDELVRVRS